MELVRLPNVGERFLDQWLIEAEVGKGGFSIVYRALHDDGRVAALKILTPEAQNKVTSSSYDDEVADRFLREARLLDQLDSAYTINLWDYGESEDGLLYMVFEFVDGRMLFDEIKNDGAMDHDRVIHVMRQTLMALESAHAMGILHRDIKPNNIMLYERDGDPDRVKLVDFGIAKMFDEDKALPGNDLTAAGLLVGTPRYMAPEQLKGHDLTPAADLYSLGLCAIEMLSGRKCIPGKDRVKIVERQLGPEQVCIPDDIDVAPKLAAIVHRLTEKSLGVRYVTATEAVRDLEALAGDPGTTGDTLYQDRPNLKELLSGAVDDDDTVFETVNTAQLAALLDKQREKSGNIIEEGATVELDSIDPFGQTVASKSSDLLPSDFREQAFGSPGDFGEATVEARPSLKPGFAPVTGPGPSQPAAADKSNSSGFAASFDNNYGSGQFQQPPQVDRSNAGSGQFGQPEPSDVVAGPYGQPDPSNIGSGPHSQPSDSSYGSGQFQQPPASQSYGSGQFQQPPASQSYGSGQFQQPPGIANGQPPGQAPYGSGQYPAPTPGGYGTGQYPNPTPGGVHGSGQYPQPPMNQQYGGSGYYQAPPGQFPPPDQSYGGAPPYGQPPPGHYPPGPYGPGGPPMPHAQLTGDDKLALGAGFLVPGVGQILAGQAAKGALIMVVLLLLLYFVTPMLWLLFAPLSLTDTFLLVRTQKRRPVGAFEFFADWRSLL